MDTLVKVVGDPRTRNGRSVGGQRTSQVGKVDGPCRVSRAAFREIIRNSPLCGMERI